MKKIKITTPITIKELAQKLNVGPNEVIAKSIELGEMVANNTALVDEDTITIIVHEFDADAEFVTEIPKKEKTPTPEAPADTKKLVYKKILVNFWRTRLHDEELGIHQQLKYQAKTRWYSKNFDMEGVIEEDDQKKFVIAFNS